MALTPYRPLIRAPNLESTAIVLLEIGDVRMVCNSILESPLVPGTWENIDCINVYIYI